MSIASNHSALASFKKELVEKARAEDQAKLAERIEQLSAHLNKRYATTKNGVTKHVYLVEVKKRDVKLKRDLSAKDSFSESIETFVKFYRLDE